MGGQNLQLTYYNREFSNSYFFFFFLIAPCIGGEGEGSEMVKSGRILMESEVDNLSGWQAQKKSCP